MDEEDNRFKAWLEDRHPHVKLLLDEEVSIEGVNFFGGTVWNDFTGDDLRAMEPCHKRLTNSDQENPDPEVPLPMIGGPHRPKEP